MKMLVVDDELGIKREDPHERIMREKEIRQTIQASLNKYIK